MANPHVRLAELSQILLKVSGRDQSPGTDLNAAELAFTDQFVDHPEADLEPVGDFSDGIDQVVCGR
jgi:hypothetical protein